MSDFGLRIGIEGDKAFKESLREINQSFKVLGSEMVLVSSQFDRQDKSAAALTARNTVLTKEIDAQREKIDTLKAALDNASTSFGETDARTLNWQTQLNKAQAELNKMERELDSNNKAMKSHSDNYDTLGKEIEKTVREYVRVRDEYGKNSDEAKALEARLQELAGQHREAGKAADAEDKAVAEVTESLGLYQRETGKSADETGKFAKAMDVLKDIGKVVAGVAVAVGGAVSSVAVGMFGMAKSVADAGKEISNTSQKLGLSREGFQEWDYILKKSGTSIDVMGVGMRTLQKTMGGLTEDGDSASKAFARVGISFDEIKGKTPEEALNMTVRALQEMPPGADRTAAAMKLFGRGAMELQPLLNRTAEQTDELRQRAHDLGLVLGDEQLDAAARFRSAMGGIKDTMAGMKLQISSSLVPAFADGLAAFLDFANGVQGGEEKMRSAIDNMTAAISSTLPQFIEKGAQMISAIVTGMSSALPAVAEALAGVLPRLIGVLTSLVPPLVNAAMSAVPSIVNAIISALPSIVSAGAKVILALADGLAQMLPQLVPIAIDAVMKVIETIIMLAPMLVAAGAELMGKLAEGLGNAIPILQPISMAIQGIMSALQALAPVIVAAAAGFGALMIVSTIAKAMQALQGATLAQTIATYAQAVANNIVAAAQWVWNTALLANPIVAIIAGVVALIAVIAVLVMWFNRDTEEQKALKESTKKLVEENDRLIDSIETSSQAYADRQKDMAAEAGAVKSLADKIAELSRVENKSAEQKKQLAAYVDMLNEAMGETVVSYDEEADALSRNVTEIYSLVEARKEEAKAQAARERAVEIAKEQMMVEEQLNEVSRKRAELDQALADGVYKKGENDKKYKEVLNELNDTEAALLGQQEELAASFDFVSQAAVDAATAQEEANATLVDSTETVTAAMQEATDIQTELAAQKKRNEEEVTEAMTIAASQQGLTLEEYKAKLKTTEDALKKYTSATTEMFKKIDQKSTDTAKSMAENLKHNQKVTEEWSTNLINLSERGIRGGLLDKLQAAGPESASLVQNLVNASDTELAELQTAFENGTDAAIKVMMEQMGMPDVTNSGSDMVDNIAAGVDQNAKLKTATEQLIKTAKATASSTVSSSGFGDIGNQIVNGVWQGIQTREAWFRSQVSSFFKRIVNSVKSDLGIQSPSRVFAGIGENMAQGLGVGFGQSMNKVAADMQNAIPTRLEAGYAVTGGVGGVNGGRGVPGGAVGGINVTQNIYTPQYDYAAQQLAAAREFRQIARQLA